MATRIEVAEGEWRAEKIKRGKADGCKVDGGKADGCKADAPCLITVMGKRGHILLQMSRTRDLRVFYNQGNPGDGLQLARSCLRNMLSEEFNNIVCINAYKGYYLAVAVDQTSRDIVRYRPKPQYAKNLGQMEYVALSNVSDFAEHHGARISPKLGDYFDELENYMGICREIADELA